MRKKIFLRCFAVSLASSLIMFIFGFLAVKINAESVMKERLIEETEIVALLLDNKNDFEKFKVYEGDDEFRITVFDTQGNVLLESDTQAVLENHLDREEIQDALSGAPKTVKRYSETFKCEMTYYAILVEIQNSEPIILRLAIRSSQLSSYLIITLPVFLFVLLISLVLSIVISHFISLNISTKITSVGKSLKSVNMGEYIPIHADKNEPELYSVLCEINKLNESTHAHIIEIEGEHKKLGRVLDNISQGIIALDKMKQIAFINKSTREIFGYRAEVSGKGISAIVDDLALLSKISSHIYEDYSFESSYKDKELSFVIKELAHDELTISTIIIITDITSEKAIEKQKSDFFANASHELKTPITVMQGLSELVLSNGDINDATRVRIERIHKESVRLSSLISDMLLLSRMERGDEAQIPLCAVSLASCVSEVYEELSEKIAEKALTFTLSGDATVLAEPKKIFELVENLLSNAINYNKPNGKIEVLIEENEKSATLCIKDTGIGIEKKHIPMLCQRFYRVDKSHSKKTGGTGLGLAIVKHVCALYGAQLEIESELGVGSVFTVTFNKGLTH